MQLDSHRRQLSGCGPISLPIEPHVTSTATPQPPAFTSDTMPCRFARFSPPTFVGVDPDAPPNTAALEAYTKNRRTTLFLLRRQTRILIFLFALLESVWRGPYEIVFAKNFNCAIDHGFVYTAGYIISWVYMCVFGVVWGSLFEWWVPTLENESPTLDKTASILKQINLVIIPGAIGVDLAIWGAMALFTVAGGHFRLKHTSRAKSSIITAGSIAWAVSFGYYSLEMLKRMGIAKVRWQMDAWVLLPIAINIGTAIGTGLVGKIERKQIARAEIMDAENRAISVEEFLAEEKQPLMDV